MSRQRKGPNPLLIVVIGALMVFGGYYVWTGLLNFLENQGNLTAPVTQEARASAIAQAFTSTPRPTFFQAMSPTPLPPCLDFEVRVERAIYREAPCSDDDRCPRVDSMTMGTRVCVYGRSPDNAEWYIVELNPGGAFRDIVYMHESVIVAVNPTPTPTQTFTPLPTVSPVPSGTPTPTPRVSPTPEASEEGASTPTPTPPPAFTPTLTPSPTPPRILI